MKLTVESRSRFYLIDVISSFPIQKAIDKAITLWHAMQFAGDGDRAVFEDKENGIIVTVEKGDIEL